MTRQPVTDEQLAEMGDRADVFEVALSDHPDTDCPPVCEIGAAVADDTRSLIAEVRALRVREAELQQRIDNALAVCAQLSPSVAAVRAALTGTQSGPDQLAADE